MKYALLLPVLFLAATVCFGQLDSLDVPVQMKITHKGKPIDTQMVVGRISITKIVPKNKTFKVRISGTYDTTTILRIIDAKPKPISDNDTLKCDSLEVLLTVRVTKVYGLRTVSGGPIINPPDSTILQSPGIGIPTRP